MSSTVKVTDSSFETEVLKADVPVIVDFWADWCGPCRMIAPALDELAKEYSGKIKIAKVNVDENQRYAGELGVRSIPMLFMFKGGKVVSQMLGAKPKSSLDAWIRDAI